VIELLMMLGGIGRLWKVSMDEQKLREHYEKTGNLMGILRDPEVLREMVKAEDDCMGSILLTETLRERGGVSGLF
jgi:hypothetical protein